MQMTQLGSALGWAYAGIVTLAFSHGIFIAALQRHATTFHPWQSKLYQAIEGVLLGREVRCVPGWDSGER